MKTTSSLVERIILPPLALILLIVLVGWVSWQCCVEEDETDLD